MKLYEIVSPEDVVGEGQTWISIEGDVLRAAQIVFGTMIPEKDKTSYTVVIPAAIEEPNEYVIFGVQPSGHLINTNYRIVDRTAEGES